jgi:hypothetical protein
MLHAALNRKRRELGLTWVELPAEVGPAVSATMLTRLAKGGRVNIILAMTCSSWLETELSTFRRKMREE